MDVSRLLSIVPVAAFLSCTPAIAAQGAPDVETAKQALTARWMKLKLPEYQERNVLFQSIRAGKPESGSYVFRVSALVRDYNAGYPANRYYGRTCVGRIEELDYTLSPDGFGGWEVAGRMTPPQSVCKDNPAEGVSSQPVSSLPGAPAASSSPAGSAAPVRKPVAASASAGDMAPGPYECWANGQPRLLMNFTVRGPGRYTGSDGKAGSYSIDAATSRVTFRGGALDGVMPDGFIAVYSAPQGRPKVSFRSGREGAEVSFCAKK